MRARITDTLFTGTAAYQGGKLGASVASGDFNGDGVRDLAMGAPGMQSPRGTGKEGLVFMALQQNLWVNSGSGKAPSA